MTEPASTNLLESDREGLTALMRDLGQPAFRGKQVYRQLYVNRAPTVEAMTDLPKDLRTRLGSETSVGSLTLKRVLNADRGLTRKALFSLPDGSPIETVLMVYRNRATVCVSSQSGCPMQCTFCATGKLGHLHDLTCGQMVEQVLWAAREISELAIQNPGHADHLTNLVFMGMGEPFNNYDAWWASVERLHDPEGFNLGARHFTVSTVGLVPGIRRLAQERLPVNLAISLHAPDDAMRSSMMPVNKRFPIADLMQAVADYLKQTRRRVSFEYVLLQEQNDRPDQALALAKLLRNPRTPLPPQLFHVNLIPWNPVPGSPLARSHRQRVLDFQQVLRNHQVPCTVRVERGLDIGAACGQLAGEEQEVG